MIIEQLKPVLRTPFPNMKAVWTDPITGLKVPKGHVRNLKWRAELIENCEKDEGYRNEVWTACSESILYWINAFMWTYHQFDVESDGTRTAAACADVPMITWEVQDNMLTLFLQLLYAADEKDRDILVNKSRDMGASWCCIAFIHWLWLFKPDSQLLELSRTEPYVDQSGNMKALFQRHDYVNVWLPDWMRPPNVLVNQANRTKMHMFNEWNGSCIDGESTTEHAASGDRRLVILLDEFAKVKHGRLMRSATRDAGLMRIVNSTVAGAGTEYSQWKNSGQIRVFPLMWWDHPDKGNGRYVVHEGEGRGWKIRSPWYDNEDAVRSPQEMAREIDAEDVESGDMFFSVPNIDKHIFLFGREPDSRHVIDFVYGVSNDAMHEIIREKSLNKVSINQHLNGPLRVWAHLIKGRLDQTKSYSIGIDLSKGMGASNTVFSIRCRETNVKVAEWRDANTPPYEAARIGVALCLWVGGKDGLPFQKWENNGPGWDYGRYMAKQWKYPKFYFSEQVGKVRKKKTLTYGWQSGPRQKYELLKEYDRALAHGGYVNPCVFALQEARTYIYYNDISCGPASLIEENATAKKTHGDCVIADALSLDPGRIVALKIEGDISMSMRTPAGRKQTLDKKRKSKRTWKHAFNYSK